jgi:tetraacyldisaccharide 4'-kinase
MGNNRSIFLYPFSLIYGLITAIRNFLFNTNVLRSHEYKIPVICVGNLAVGGTGKTPHTEYLVNLLRKDFSVAVLSRGYRRKTRGFLFADKNSGVADIGDEPLQVCRKFPDVTVAVDSNRVRGVETILQKKPDTAVIILDDGFQHRRITPGFSILLSESGGLMINDHMLPYGNLREYAGNMNRADVILITKSPEDLTPIQRRIIVKNIGKAPYQNLYFTSITYLEPVPVFDDYVNPTANPLIKSGENEPGIVLVTGIANPQPLFDHLGKTVSEIVHLSFSDHRSYTEKDIDKITDSWNNLKSQYKYIITTEKDAVRLREFANIAEPARSSFYYIPVGIHFLNDDQDEFNNLIVDYVRKNKPYNRIS